MKTKKSGKKGSYFFDIGIIVVSVVVIVFSSIMIFKQIGRYTTVESQISVQEMTLLKNSSYLQTLQQLSDKKYDLQEAYRKSEQYIPKGERETEIITSLTTYIEETGGTVSQFRFDNYKKLSGFSKTTYSIPFSLRFTGSYKCLIDVLDLMSTSDRLTVVKRVNIVRIENLSSTDDITIEIKGECFFY